MPLTALVRALLQIGTNTLGPNAQLEDMVGLIESMAATKLYDGDAVTPNTDGAPQACPEDHAIELVTGAIASLCSAITYECTAAGLRYGLALEDMALVLEKTSGWSESSRSIYTQLLSSHALDNTALSSEKNHPQSGLFARQRSWRSHVDRQCCTKPLRASGSSDQRTRPDKRLEHVLQLYFRGSVQALLQLQLIGGSRIVSVESIEVYMKTKICPDAAVSQWHLLQETSPRSATCLARQTSPTY